MELTSLDLVVVAGYFLIVVAVGFWAGRGERDAVDYFLAGRRLPWALIGLSLYASNMSGASFVGLMGAAYDHGMVVFNYEWTATLVLVFFALFMAPVFLRKKLFTVPEYLETRFDRRSRWAFAGLNILTLIFIDIAGALYAGGVVISTMFPVLTLWQASAGLALVAGSYTLFGGLRAVVVTDALQAVLMIAGAALIFVLGLERVGGWDALMATLEESKTRLVAPADSGFLPWPGIAGVVLLGFYYWTLNQYFVQRALGARSLTAARRGALFGGLLKLPNLVLMILPGMIAIVLLPDLDKSDQAFAALAQTLLPAGLAGLVLTALIAAIMSSLDSALSAASSLLTMDFVRPLRPGISARALLRVGRIFTGLLIVMATFYAPVIEQFGSLFEYFQSTLSYLVPPIVTVYLGGLFWRRFTATGAVWAIGAGLGAGVVLFVLQEVTGAWAAAGLPPIHFTYVAVLSFVLSGLVMAAVSLAGPAPPGDAVSEAVLRRDDLAGDAAPTGPGRLLDHRILSAALMVLLIGMLLALA